MQRNPVVLILLAVLLMLGVWLALAHAAHAFDAVIAECHDGDTCRLTDGTRIRLHAADAPELDQPYGDQARVLINQLVAGRHVDVRPTGDYSHHRIVADLVLPDGRDVAAAMVTRGYAWVEAQWNTDPWQPSRQLAAQQAHRGLWVDPNAVPPWVWRHGHMHDGN